MSKIVSISGRRITVDNDGNRADYIVLRSAKIFLNGQPAQLGQLDNGDEVQLGGIKVNGVSIIKATRPEGQLPESVQPQTTDHFPPRPGDTSIAEERKKAMLPQTAQQVPPEPRKAEDPDIDPTGRDPRNADASSQPSGAGGDGNEDGNEDGFVDNPRDASGATSQANDDETSSVDTMSEQEVDNISSGNTGNNRGKKPRRGR